MSKPKILYLPTSSHTEQVFPPEVFARFQEQFDVTLNETAQATQAIKSLNGLLGLRV